MELVSRCVECGLAEPESLASLGGSAPGVVDGILSKTADEACVGRAFVAWDFGDGYEEDGVGGIDAIVR